MNAPRAATLVETRQISVDIPIAESRLLLLRFSLGSGKHGRTLGP